jgi:bacillithiol system protein YtxJ
MDGWKDLSSIEELDNAIVLSNEKAVVLFKHSTRCSISTMVHNRIEKSAADLAAQAHCYYLDLIAFRDVSSAIAEKLGVMHESPQILVVKNGVCNYSATHYDIRANEVLENI